VAFPQSGSSSTESKLELKVLLFAEGGNTGEPGEKYIEKQGDFFAKSKGF
jgi:hypothetical protein